MHTWQWRRHWGGWRAGGLSVQIMIFKLNVTHQMYVDLCQSIVQSTMADKIL
jgi:hypothetical protein